MLIIFHNPRCRKSRECLGFLENSNLKFEVVKYLETKFTFETLSDIIKKLNIQPIELVRVKEKIWTESYKGKSLTNGEIINAMVANPVLIERPIVVNGKKVVIARPFDNINTIL